MGDLPETTLREIDLRYRAKDLERFGHARTLIELKMSELSARQLGKEEEESATKEDEDKDRSKYPAWEARGEEIKEEIRKGLYYTFAPEHVRAMMDTSKAAQVEPLRGISPAVARTVLQLLEANTFTHGAWGSSKFREQLGEGDARDRLEVTAGG